MGLTYLLETDTCVEIIRARSATVIARLGQEAPDNVGLSAITLAELRFGAERSSNPLRNLGALAAFIRRFVILDFDARAAEAYGVIRIDLQRAGMTIGPLDTLIAAHALALGLTLVTSNEREFRRVPNLVVENWLTAN